jgi:hypothetical protein
MADGTQDEAPEAPSALDVVQARRRARKDAARKADDDAFAADLEAIDALEESLGDANVDAVRVAYTPGLPAAAAVRCPTPVQFKRYRDRITPRKDARNRDVEPDPYAAAEELAAVCLVYPDKDVYKQMCAARPGLASQLGAAAVRLAVGAEADEGKG